MKNSLRKSFGLAQIPLMIALLLMAVAVPVATKLVQNNADNRNMAAGSCSSVTNATECAYIPGCRWVENKCSGAYPTAKPTGTTKNCLVKTCSKNKCVGENITVGSSKACPKAECVNDISCKGGVVPTGANPTSISGAGAKCNTGGGWPGICKPRSECSEGSANIAYDGAACGGTLGCCGVRPSSPTNTCSSQGGYFRPIITRCAYGEITDYSDHRALLKCCGK